LPDCTERLRVGVLASCRQNVTQVWSKPFRLFVNERVLAAPGEPCTINRERPSTTSCHRSSSRRSPSECPRTIGVGTRHGSRRWPVSVRPESSRLGATAPDLRRRPPHSEDARPGPGERIGRRVTQSTQRGEEASLRDAPTPGGVAAKAAQLDFSERGLALPNI